MLNISAFLAKSPELLIAEIAARQHGVLTIAQLYTAGLDRNAVAHRVRTGRLHRLYRGVYAVGNPRPSREGEWLAAVFASGPGAILSHRPAAVLWRLLSHANGPIDVTVATGGGRARRDGIRLHRSTTLPKQQSARRLNIPVTTPARTLEDLRSCATPDELSLARRQAEFFGYRVEAAQPNPIERSRSELERRFVRLCARHHLPAPQVNAPLLGYEVDFLWPFAKLIAETDGYDGHSGRNSFEYDRRRDAKLAAAGYDVIRFTWRQVTEHPEEVVAALRSRLTRVLPSRSS